MNNKLVSIGFPTFCRVNQAKERIYSLVNQTYKNIEIIISNNNPDPDELDLFIEDIQQKDGRVKYYKQSSNIGPNENFKFVLAKSNGYYFLWAADDDFLDSSFIEKAIFHIGDKSAIFSYYKTFSLSSGEISNTMIIGLDNQTKYDAIFSFFVNRTPSLVYSLYKKSDIEWFLEYTKDYDWCDCYIIQKIILKGNGFNIIPEYLFTATSRGNNLLSVRKRKFRYKIYLIESFVDILSSSLTITQKLKICFILIDVTIRSYASLEELNTLQKFLFRAYVKIAPHVKYQRLY